MRSQHSFSNVPSISTPRSSFNLSHPHKTAFDADLLVPICQPIDIIPGDTFSMQTSFFMRLATPLAPILDNMRFESFAFFVAYRTIWDNFEKFHGAQDSPADSIDFTIPIIRDANNTDTNLGSQWDYFGLPTLAVPDDVVVSALPFRAYAKIFHDWFRDENLQDKATWQTDNGPDDLETAFGRFLFVRGKKKDYFTSCLPWPQKGTAVAMPLGDQAPIFTDKTTTNRIWVDKTQGGPDQFDFAVGSGSVIEIGPNTQSAGEPGLWADLTGASAATINDIRLAFQTQRLLERDARAGTRYVEILKSQWGTTSPDFRLQRAEFLGGGSTIVNITPVQQQSAQTTPVQDDKLGNLAAYGTVSGTHSWSKSFVEHGVVIILGNLRGDITYSQGIDRYWSKATRYDFYYPVLAGIGEQSVLNKEIWVTGTGTPATDNLVFGYQERYAEYRFLTGKLTNIMRPASSGGTDTVGSLASWHLSEDFASLPTLGATFIEANTRIPLDRAVAIPSEPHMIADFWHEIKAARPLPVHGIPGNLDRL